MNKKNLARTARISRKTAETEILLKLNADGSGETQFATGIPFLEHLLHQLARHGGLDLEVSCKGDLEIDAHHSTEDIGIVMGQALAQILADKTGITRYGYAYAPLDEALSRAVVDLSGRPGLFLRVDWTAERIGVFDTQLVREFFQGMVNHAGITLHLDCLTGINCHHQAESLFKACALALKQALQRGEGKGIPSTKRVL